MWKTVNFHLKKARNVNILVSIMQKFQAAEQKYTNYQDH